MMLIYGLSTGLLTVLFIALIGRAFYRNPIEFIPRSGVVAMAFAIVLTPIASVIVLVLTGHFEWLWSLGIASGLLGGYAIANAIDYFSIARIPRIVIKMGIARYLHPIRYQRIYRAKMRELEALAREEDEKRRLMMTLDESNEPVELPREGVTVEGYLEYPSAK